MIPGLSITPDFITASQSGSLIAFIQQQLDKLPVTTDGSTGRTRILRFGHDYDPPHLWLRDIPPELAFIPSNAVTINEYEPGHGIAPHFDSQSFPGPISVLSLNAIAIIAFHKFPLLERYSLHPNSLTVMDGDARNLWKHSVPPILPGRTRYSIVFRTHA